HALQHLAAVEREWLVATVFLDDEFAEKEIDAIVPRHVSVRGEIEPRQRIGKSFVPAGQRRVVVTRVVAIPTEHDVAKAEAAFDRRLELVLVNIFAAQHAVDVGYRDLDAVPGRFAYRGDDLRGRGRSRHKALSPAVLLSMCGSRILARMFRQGAGIWRDGLRPGSACSRRSQ